MLRWRLLLGTILVAAILILGWIDQKAAIPGSYLFPIAIVVTILGAGEIVRMMRLGKLKPIAPIVYVGSVLIVTAAWVPVAGSLFGFEGGSGGSTEGISTISWPLLMFGLVIVASFLGEMWRYTGPGGVTINLAGTIFGTAYVGLLLSFVVMLRLNWTVGALASLIVVVKMGDTGAYTVGRLIGRHKMAPVLSPGKTIEGACGAIAFAVLGSWLVAGLLFPYWLGVNVTGWIPYGILVGLAGLFGDLSESLIKRDVGTKDSSEWLPGFGGVLDILDSILFAAPVAYACWAVGLIQIGPH